MLYERSFSENQLDSDKDDVRVYVISEFLEE